jgi:glycosyltransferase involved in cell wall biosynthesis
MKLTVVIPSYKDPLLHKTIDSLLENSELGTELEIIPVLDGYWPVTPIKNNPRVRVVHLGGNRGMRGAINAGVAVARGEFIMRMDEHQIVGKGYDRILTETCQPNWIVTPRRYYLDPVKWEVMDKPYEDHAKLVIQGGVKFAGQRWESRNEATKDEMISETLAMQGSCWVMPRKWWDDVIGELQTEGYGPLIQDSHEMVFKTWKAGGKLMVNKNTWHAHKHRSFARTHNNGTKENPANCDAGYKYALDVWGSYYLNEIKPKWKI